MFKYTSQNGNDLTREEAKQHVRLPASVVVISGSGRATIENVAGTSPPLHVFDAANHHVGSMRMLGEAIELAELTVLSQEGS